MKMVCSEGWNCINDDCKHKKPHDYEEFECGHSCDCNCNHVGCDCITEKEYNKYLDKPNLK
jgi:hypothetical protein